MTTLITGSSGFVGLALAEHLLAQGRNVVGFDLSAAPAAALEIFAGMPGRFFPVRGDVRDTQALASAIAMHKPQRLVSLAAITADADRERAQPQSIFEVNVGGTLAAVNSAALAGLQRVVHISSGSAYGASGRQQARLHESDTALAPENLYGISKRAAEDAVRRLADLTGIDTVIGRLGTCFGPWEADTGVRDTPSAPLQILRLAHAGAPVILPRASRRDWLYVRDAAAAIAAVLDTPRLGYGLYNLAAGFEWGMDQWCERIAQYEAGFSWRIAANGEAPNVDYYAAYDRASMDISRLRADTDFAPSYDMARAYDDFQDWIARAGAVSFTSKANHA